MHFALHKKELHTSWTSRLSFNQKHPTKIWLKLLHLQLEKFSLELQTLKVLVKNSNTLNEKKEKKRKKASFCSRLVARLMQSLPKIQAILNFFFSLCKYSKLRF